MKHKRKLIYISPGYFIDVDIPVITELNKYYDFKWIIILGAENYYTTKTILEVCSENKINQTIFRNKYRKRNIYQIFSSIRLIKLIKLFKPDIIYFEQFDNPYLSLLSFFTLSIKKIVVGVHDVIPHLRHSKLIGYLHKKAYIFLFKNFHLFSSTQGKIFSTNYKKKNIFIAKLNLKDFGHKPYCRRQDSKINFLFFGRIKYYKGLDILIKAGNILAKDYSNFRIIIKGFCEDFTRYQEIIDNGNFEIDIKYIPNKEVPCIFAKSDYLILPYRDVTQSGPLLIAYNYCVPVIASNLDGFKEYIVDRENGFLFKSESVEELVICMKIIIQMEKNQQNRIKNNLKKFVKQNINKNDIAQKYINFFNNL